MWKPLRIDHDKKTKFLFINAKRVLALYSDDKGNVSGKAFNQQKLDQSDVNTMWTLSIVTSDLKFEDNNLVYDEDKSKLPDFGVDVLASKRFNNPVDNVILEDELVHTSTRTRSFTWGLNQRFMVSHKISITAGLPDVAEIKAETTYEAELGAEQSWKDETVITLSIKQKVYMEGIGHITVVVSIDWAEGYEIDFTLYVWISGTAETLDCDVQQLNAEQLESIAMDFEGCTGKVIGSDEKDGAERIHVELKGTMVASFGLEANVQVIDHTKNAHTAGAPEITSSELHIT